MFFIIVFLTIVSHAERLQGVTKVCMIDHYFLFTSQRMTFEYHNVTNLKRKTLKAGKPLFFVSPI